MNEIYDSLKRSFIESNVFLKALISTIMVIAAFIGIGLLVICVANLIIMAARILGPIYFIPTFLVIVTYLGFLVCFIIDKKY